MIPHTPEVRVRITLQQLERLETFLDWKVRAVHRELPTLGLQGGLAWVWLS